ETYKRHAVELTLRGDRTVKAVAKELGIAPWALYEWRGLYAGRPGDNRPAPRTLAEAEAEIADLRAEVVRMRERETALKKSLGILSETPASGMPRSRR
ncbi:MAG: transposase, partial [Opitutaceae bacterium]